MTTLGESRIRRALTQQDIAGLLLHLFLFLSLLEKVGHVFSEEWLIL